MSSTCFGHPSVHPLEYLYMQFMVFLSCIRISIPVDALDQPAYTDVFSIPIFFLVTRYSQICLSSDSLKEEGT